MDDIFGGSGYNEINDSKKDILKNGFDGIEDIKPRIFNAERLTDANGGDITDEILNDISQNFDDYKCMVIDMDGDGIIDTIISSNNYDAGSGKPYHDYKDDLVLDEEESAENKGPNENVQDGRNDFNEYFGDKINGISDWHMQEFNDSGVIVSQEFIIKKLLDADIDEVGLRNMAIENGWQSEGCGMPLSNVGKLLEHYGISTEKGFGRNMDDISRCLNAGGGVIAALDSDIVSENSKDAVENSVLRRNSICTVNVTDIDTESGDINVHIIHPALGGIVMSQDDFMESWGASDNFMIEAYK